MDDPYAVLGLDRRAGKTEIKTAYRALAKVWHPDRHRGDPVARERFVEISEAYRALLGGGRDGAAGEAAGGFAGGRAAPAERTTRKAAAPSPRPSRGQRPEPTDDEMMERIFGVSPFRRKIDDAPGLDSAADGEPHATTASRPERPHAAEPSRHGRSLLLALNALFGRRPRARQQRESDRVAAAPAAETLKARVSVPLATVLTGGTVEAALPDGRPVVADIARGASEGSVLVLPPETCGTEAPVELTVVYAQSDAFRSVGADLHMSLAIGLETAVLGGPQSIDTLDGPIRLTVPAWSGSDRTLRISGRGLPKAANDGRGDLLVHLRVLLPESADPRIVDLMKQRKEGLYV